MELAGDKLIYSINDVKCNTAIVTKFKNELVFRGAKPIANQKLCSYIWLPSFVIHFKVK